MCTTDVISISIITRSSYASVYEGSCYDGACEPRQTALSSSSDVNSTSRLYTTAADVSSDAIPRARCSLWTVL